MGEIMAWSSTHRYARISPRKARLVIDMIRGMKADQAVNLLRFTHKRAASMALKVLQSAIANADEAEADIDSLYITDARVDEGPTMKRIQPKDRGRAFIIRKRTSHIIIKVDEKK